MRYCRLKLQRATTIQERLVASVSDQKNTSKDIYSACLAHFYTNLTDFGPGFRPKRLRSLYMLGLRSLHAHCQQSPPADQLHCILQSDCMRRHVIRYCTSVCIHECIHECIHNLAETHRQLNTFSCLPHICISRCVNGEYWLDHAENAGKRQVNYRRRSPFRRWEAGG